MITYDELASVLEDAWVMAGLHEHLLLETISPDTMERFYKAELFPMHPEPLTPSTSPPWVEVAFTWTAHHQITDSDTARGAAYLELSWTYTVDVRAQVDRNDTELVRGFHGAVHSALRKVAPDLAGSAEYVAVEVRRGYRSASDRPVAAYTQLIGTNVTDLSDLWMSKDPHVLREAMQDELIVVAAVLRALGESFMPGTIGSYRPVDTA